MSHPIQSFDFGAEQIPVFLNQGEKGPYLNAKLNGRGYQDDAGQWQQSYSYTATQLAAHIGLCQRVLGYMLDNKPSKTAASHPAQSQPTGEDAIHF